MGVLREYVKIAGAVVLRSFAKLFWVFPIRKNRVVFSSYSGLSYSCNPKYICEYMKMHCPDYELVWLLAVPENAAAISGIKAVRYRSLKRFYYLATAGYIITNIAPDVLVPKRKGQTLIQTWHAGGAYKTVAHSQAQQRKASVWYVNKAREYIDLFLSSSARFTETNIIDGYQYSGKVLNSGLPRNDLFFDRRLYSAVREKTRSDLKLRDKYVALFAPTYRGTTKRAEELKCDLDFRRILSALQEKTGREAVLLVRLHHHDKHLYRFYGDETDVSSYPDMQELLCAADMLITDYSSCMWDYALTGKPCLLYVPDVDEYIRNRGLYTPVETWPGVVCKSTEDAMTAIHRLDEIDFNEIARKHLEYMALMRPEGPRKYWLILFSGGAAAFKYSIGG